MSSGAGPSAAPHPFNPLFKLGTGSGYTDNLKIYYGKNLEVEKTVPTDVLSLADNLLHQGRTMCADIWYTNVELTNKFLDANTHLIGTLHSYRKVLPKSVTTKKMKKGEIFAEENRRGITILNRRDQRNVQMLSTKHSVEIAEVQSRGGSKIKPKMITEYNTTKSSVDLSDQMGAYSNPLRKTIKWYH